MSRTTTRRRDRQRITELVAYAAAGHSLEEIQAKVDSLPPDARRRIIEQLRGRRTRQDDFLPSYNAHD
jgi:hypothetical protein